MLQPRRGRGAFKLIELLLVVAILGTLLALLLPAVQRVRESANVALCAWHLHQINLAFQAHLTAHNYYPTGGNVHAHIQRTWAFHYDAYAAAVPASGAWQDSSWAYQILPNLGYEAQWKLPESYPDPKNRPKQTREIPVSEFLCPSRGGPRWVRYKNSGLAVGLDYAGNGGPLAFVNLATGEPRFAVYGSPGPGEVLVEEAVDGIIIPTRAAQREPIHKPIGPRNVPDGLSHTLLVGEKRVNARLLLDGGQPGDRLGYCAGFGTDTVRSGLLPPARDAATITPVYDGFGSAHVSGWNALFADGSVRMLSYRISAAPDAGGLTLMQRLCHRRDGGKFNLADLE